MSNPQSWNLYAYSFNNPLRFIDPTGNEFAKRRGVQMKIHAGRLVQTVLLLNMLFWLWFWIDVSRHTTLYTDRAPKFEESVPIYKFGTKALPTEAERGLGSFRSMLFCQRPSFFVVARTMNGLTNGPWDQRLGSLSIGAYALVGTMLLSFAQWGLVALLISRILDWARGGHGTAVHRNRGSVTRVTRDSTLNH